MAKKKETSIRCMCDFQKKYLPNSKVEILSEDEQQVLENYRKGRYPQRPHYTRGPHYQRRPHYTRMSGSKK